VGFTHYYRRKKTLPVAPFRAWRDDVAKIIEAVKDRAPVAWEEDQPAKPPELTNTCVRFNGIDEDGHETFRVPRVFEPDAWMKPQKGLYFDFCKTARKPYDLVVVASLTRLAFHMGKAVNVSSDGDAEDWEPGMELCRKLFGEAVLPFSEDD